ncbi:hypothetical protein BD289DRAFT_486124 [Coniella lustricola]|uniref:2EXR domain-containing protein n=1 Tax=Coniella lustricola TaxID=2025994 RepID=A0A2T2ZW73_9PEZI|nr:hypothetical protein BD289DRAFT_486124 [Coniella lustricola]
MSEQRCHPYKDKIYPTRISWPPTTYVRDPVTNILAVAPCCPQYTSWTPPNLTPRSAAHRAADLDRRLWDLSRNADDYRARRTALRDNWRRQRQAWLDSTPSFPQFASLPAELRVQIWRLAAQDPGPVDLVVAPWGGLPPQTPFSSSTMQSTPSRVRVQTFIPLLHVNREAYTVVRPYYRPLRPVTEFQSMVPIEPRRDHQQANSDSCCNGTVQAACSTILHMHQLTLARSAFDMDQMPSRLPTTINTPFHERALLTELVIDVSLRGLSLYGRPESKLRMYFTGAPNLRKMTIKARAQTAGVVCPELDLLHAFWHFRYWALDRTRFITNNGTIDAHDPDWVAPEVAVLYQPGLGSKEDINEGGPDKTVLCHCERGLLDVPGLKWNDSLGVTVNSSYDTAHVSQILSPVLMPLTNELSDDIGWWA